jgi:hypothetical protein
MKYLYLAVGVLGMVGTAGLLYVAWRDSRPAAIPLTDKRRAELIRQAFQTSEFGDYEY